MNICSCVVHARPDQGPQVAARLAELPGVEVHGGVDQGKLVLTLEDTAEHHAADTLGLLNDVPGVISTVLIYHYGGSDIQTEEQPHDHHPA
jgi:nitrate reductase NapD